MTSTAHNRASRRTRAVSATFAVLLPLIAATACGTDRCNQPFGQGGSFDINQFSELYNVGGAVVINRGYNGILVRRVALADFVAFECTCPKDHDVMLQSVEGWEYAIVHCSACGSQFETEYGNPLDGSSTPCPLYQYATSFDGRTLSIY